MERSKDLILFRLNRLSAVSGRPLVRLCEGQYGITRREWRLIVILSQDGPQLSTMLAARASIEPARTSTAITVLVNKGLAERERRPSDRRYIEIRLTEKGRQVFESLYPVVEGMNDGLLASLSVADQLELERLLRSLEAAAMSLPDAIPDLPKTNRRRMK